MGGAGGGEETVITGAFCPLVAPGGD
jgi:hypothetical protein